MKLRLPILLTAVLALCTAPDLKAEGPRKLHPNYDMIDLGGLDNTEWGIGGISFLSDGRLAVVEWGDTKRAAQEPFTWGKLHIVTGVIDASNASGVTWETVATDLMEPLGCDVVDDVIYVHSKSPDGTQILKFTETSPGTWSQETFADGWNQPGYFWHSWPGGIVYQEGYFHINITSGLSNGYRGSFVGQETWPPLELGNWIRVDASTGDWKIMATGMRTNEDTWIGPWGGIWSDDNQGEWMPSSRHYYLREGRHYGHYYGNQKEVNGVPTPMSPPAIYCTHNEACNSPVGGWTLKKGMYAGQMLVCEHKYHSINRDFVEMINGEIQGAVFDFGCALRDPPIADGHPHRIITAPPPNEEIIIFATGATDPASNWASGFGPNVGALVKLVPNGTITYEMLAIRNKGETSFEIEFTKPVNVNQATQTGDYMVSTWTENPMENYGGGAKVNEHQIQVTNASIVPNSDNTKVLLEFARGDLETGSIEVSGNDITGVGQTVLFNLGSGGAFGASRVQSADGEDLFDNTAYYTLNQFGPGEDPPLGVLGCRDPAADNFDPLATIECDNCCEYTSVEIQGGASFHSIEFVDSKLTVSITRPGTYRVDITDVNGKLAASRKVMGGRSYSFTDFQQSGMYLVTIETGKRAFSKRILVF